MICVYPGSFDLITNGHLDIIKRCSKIFDEIYVTILINKYKKPMFSIEERFNHLEIVTKDFKNVKIVSYDGLLVNFLKENNFKVVIRGVRGVSEFESESMLSNGYKFIDQNIETFLIPSSLEYQFLSSSMVKELALFGGNIDGMVPEEIKDNILQKFKSM